MKGEMLSRMLHLAVIGHNGQFDKAEQPYILHPLKVMHYLKSEDEELQCIALGHDLLEDTRVTAQILISSGFSTRVVYGIECLTKIRGETYEQYKCKVLSNRDSILVKMADIRHNMDVRRLKGVTVKDLARMQRYCEFYEELKKARYRES